MARKNAKTWAERELDLIYEEKKRKIDELIEKNKQLPYLISSL